LISSENSHNHWRSSPFPAGGDSSNGVQDSRSDNSDSTVMAVLALLANSSPEEEELRPMLKGGGPDLGIVYDLGSGFEISHEKLRQVERKGLLAKSGFASFAVCPKCEDLGLQAQLSCPECTSQALIKSNLLIHYDCQSTGPIEEFQSDLHNGYFCKTCRKDLTRVGIDYGNPGIGFKCSACNKVFQFPHVLSMCRAGHSSKIDELELRSYPIYKLGNSAKGLSTLLIQSRKLKESLDKREISSKILVNQKGASGANHIIPLLLSLPSTSDKVDSDQKERIAIEFIDDASDIEKSLLQLLIKSADLDKIRMVIVCRGRFGSVEHIRAIVNPKKVKVLLAEDDLEKLHEQILKEVTAW
jgi:hypothetical protein